mgnify:CR=1 FL=1
MEEEQDGKIGGKARYFADAKEEGEQEEEGQYDEIFCEACLKLPGEVR